MSEGEGNPRTAPPLINGRQHVNGNENSKLATIRALLARAEHPTTPEAEAEQCRQKAFALMAKYGIEQAMLAADGATKDEPIDRQIVIDAPWAMERVRLINRIALALDCQLIHLGQHENGPARRVHIFGHRSDLERVDLLYTSLLIQMTGSLSAQHLPYGQSPRAWRRSWLLGFVNRVGSRLEEAQRGAQEEARHETTATGRSSALVLADRKTVVESRYRAAYPRSRKGRATTMRGTGYGDGWAAGGRADIGGRRIGRSNAGAIGS